MQSPASVTITCVQRVEAVILAWSKASLIAVFANIWLLYFVNAF
ncbi:hypothetical protein MFIFM68171_02218 [Madurella fahalii]|uniref:Uncharacterized protein n=1 Tax=Madurella fahalii TaxID=1157608 RepID=A0ABQ0G2L4_9PEZI